MNIVNELHTWIWDKRGRRDHAAGKHDDLLMSLTMATYYLRYVMERRRVGREMLKTHFEYNRQGVNVDVGNIFDDIFNDLKKNSEEPYDLDRVSPRQNYDRNRREVGGIFIG